MASRFNEIGYISPFGKNCSAKPSSIPNIDVQVCPSAMIDTGSVVGMHIYRETWLVVYPTHLTSNRITPPTHRLVLRRPETVHLA